MKVMYYYYIIIINNYIEYNYVFVLLVQVTEEFL